MSTAEQPWKNHMEHSPLLRWMGLFAWVVVCLAAGGLGAWATTPEIEGWYQTLARPDWNPPGYVFGPVWTTLYVLMGVAAWRVWSRGAAGKALTLFAVQLVLNVAWSWIFFRYHQLGWAFVEIIVLWTAIVATTVAFYRKDTWAAGLMVPYLLWVTFAAALNFTIWQMNM